MRDKVSVFLLVSGIGINDIDIDVTISITIGNGYGGAYSNSTELTFRNLLLSIISY